MFFTLFSITFFAASLYQPMHYTWIWLKLRYRNWIWKGTFDLESLQNINFEQVFRKIKNQMDNSNYMCENHPSIYHSLPPSIHLIHLPIPTYPFIHLPTIYLSIYLFIRLPEYLPICGIFKPSFTCIIYWFWSEIFDILLHLYKYSYNKTSPV